MFNIDPAKADPLTLAQYYSQIEPDTHDQDVILKLALALIEAEKKISRLITDN